VRSLGLLMGRVAVDGRHMRICLTFFIGLVAVRLWIMPLGSSLWLDETGTYWTVQNGLSQIASRSYSPPQSTTYFFVAGIAVAIAGASEIVLRLPSVIAMALAAVLLYRLGKRLLSQEAALLATLVFVCWKEVTFAACDARAYALGLLAVIGAALFLVRWLETGHYPDALGYAVLASLTVYLHYLFAVMFLVHAAYAGFIYRKDKAASLSSFCFVAVIITVLLSPLLPGFSTLISSGSIFSYVADPGVDQFLEILTPSALVGGAMAGLLVAYFIQPAGRLFNPLERPKSILLLILWAIVPGLVMFAISKLTPYKVFVPRYLLCHVPGLTLLAGWTLQGIRPAHKQLIVACFLVIASLSSSAPLRHTTFLHGGENWRDAIGTAAAIAKGTQMPVLVHTGFQLPFQQALQSDAAAASRLLAPLSLYPISGNVVPLPFRPDRSCEVYLQSLATNRLQGVDRFVLISRGDHGVFAAWLQGHFAGRFVGTPVGNFGNVSLILFERRTDNAAVY
jgi:hypothetical protein